MMVTNRCSMLLAGHQKNILHFQGGLPSHYHYTSEHCRLNIVRNLWFFQIPLLPYHRHLWRLWMQMACVVVIQLGSSMRWSSWILIRRWVDRLLRVQYGAVTMENPQWRCISYWTWEFFQCHVSFEGGYTDRSFRVQMVQKNSYSIIPSKHIESTLGPKLYKLTLEISLRFNKHLAPWKARPFGPAKGRMAVFFSQGQFCDFCSWLLKHSMCCQIMGVYRVFKHGGRMVSICVRIEGMISRWI